MGEYIAMKHKGDHGANFVITGCASDDKVGIMTTFGFQCIKVTLLLTIDIFLLKNYLLKKSVSWLLNLDEYGLFLRAHNHG